jgi:hypothetical protein
MILDRMGRCSLAAAGATVGGIVDSQLHDLARRAGGSRRFLPPEAVPFKVGERDLAGHPA